MATLNVGIIGSGGIAVQHAIGYRDNAPRARMVAFADVTPERNQYLNQSYAGGKAKEYADYHELLADPNVEAVDICLPHHLHTDAIIAAAKAGKAILCEKPLCTSLEDSAKIDAALKETGVTFMMAHNQLFQPTLMEAQRMIATGILGKPYYIRSIEVFQHRGFTAPAQAHLRVGESPFAWRADPARMGGGEVLDTGWHSSYRLLALANSRPVSVTAMTERFFVPNIPSEDTGVLLVRFESGAIGEIVTSWAFSTVHAWHFEVAGELGAIAGGRSQLAHQLHGWAEPAIQENAPVHSFTAEITHFLDVVQNGAECRSPFSQAARVLQLTKGAYAAVQQGVIIDLPENPVEPGVPSKGK